MYNNLWNHNSKSSFVSCTVLNVETNDPIKRSIHRTISLPSPPQFSELKYDQVSHISIPFNLQQTYGWLNIIGLLCTHWSSQV